MKRNRRVKILATLGPASDNEEAISKLVEAGADIFRINMSHASHEILQRTIEYIRSVEKNLKRPLGILVDLQGPKIRIGEFAENEINLENGSVFTMDTNEEPGNENRVHLPHPELFQAVKKGHRLLLDDGRIELRALEVTSDLIKCETVHGGTLSNRKGVSVPDSLLDMGPMTKKDHADLNEALKHEIDWIALSFVQRPQDITQVKKITRGRVGVMAKIEKPQAIQRLGEIIKLADALMIARGDLGVEMPLEQVPGLQKRMIRLARRYGKPVVVATQMLESMVSSPTPTRAEVSDVSTAVFEGADAIMLSAESASGDFPVEAVSTMDRVAIAVESDINYPAIIRAQSAEPEATAADAISAATRQTAETLDLAAIVTYTSSGSTGLRAARERPAKPIIALSPNISTVRRLSLVWGIHCVQTEDANDLEDMVDKACSIAHLEGFAKPGERIAITAGVPLRISGSTNMLRIAFVNRDGAGAS